MVATYQCYVARYQSFVACFTVISASYWPDTFYIQHVFIKHLRSTVYIAGYTFSLKL